MASPNEMIHQSIGMPDQFLPPTPLPHPSGTPLHTDNYSLNPSLGSVADIQAPLSMQSDTLLHSRTTGYPTPQTPMGMLSGNSSLLPPASPMYSGKNSYPTHTPAPHLQHMDEVPQLHVDQLNSILEQDHHPLMENMGYDHNNPAMANMGYDEYHPPAQTPGNLSEKGQATPWNEDYEFPNSVGPVSVICNFPCNLLPIAIVMTKCVLAFCSPKNNKQTRHTSSSRKEY